MKKRYVINATAFDSRHRLIGQGTNNYKKTHPLQAYFAKMVGHPHKIYIHAELAAILKTAGKDITTLYITRYDMEGNMRNAKPCPICMEAIKAFGVQEILYTTDEGWIHEWVKRTDKNSTFLKSNRNHT